MLRITPALLLCAATALLSSCANPINAHTAQKYYQLGAEAERSGDLALARTNFSRAYGNAQMGNLGAAAEASYLYEYGRLTGYIGDLNESEKAFSDVLTLIDKANGEADRLLAPTLAEYSRLLHDTGQHQKAIPIYERALVELEKVDIESRDPRGYAVFLDDYSKSLQSVGLLERASTVAARSKTLEAAHKNGQPHFQPRRYEANP